MTFGRINLGIEPPQENKNGWLSPNGKFYSCLFRKGYYEHEWTAEVKLHRSSIVLEKEGWCRLHWNLWKRGGLEAPYSCARRPTAEQRNWLSENGYPELDEYIFFH